MYSSLRVLCYGWDTSFYENLALQKSASVDFSTRRDILQQTWAMVLRLPVVFRAIKKSTV